MFSAIKKLIIPYADLQHIWLEETGFTKVKLGHQVEVMNAADMITTKFDCNVIIKR